MPHHTHRPHRPNLAERAADSVGEFCAAVGISRTTFYVEVNRGRIRPVKCGRRTLVPATEREAWLRRLAAGEDE